MEFTFDSKKTTKVTRPELLQQHNIPKPMHGMNPRSILGKEWWDDVRHIAYAQNNFHCWACGVSKFNVEFHQWLEAHESYDIDYEDGKMELKEIVALCHSCHNFIHNGRMWAMFTKGKLEEDKFVSIMKHGFSVLKSANLKPSIEASMVWKMYEGYDMESAYELSMDNSVVFPSDKIASWDKWRLVLYGEEHYSQFENALEWRDYYN